MQYGPNGFQRRDDGSAPVNLSIVMCDDRGNKAISGATISAARALFIIRTGRAEVSRSVSRIDAAGGVMSCQVKGFTLVEVLVALVIFAVGLLGIAALHIEGLNAGRTALNRTQAVALASDLADRIRANRQACTRVSPAANMKATVL